MHLGYENSQSVQEIKKAMLFNLLQNEFWLLTQQKNLSQKQPTTFFCKLFVLNYW
jgi:hypothetical protein